MRAVKGNLGHSLNKQRHRDRKALVERAQREAKQAALLRGRKSSWADPFRALNAHDKAVLVQCAR